MEAAFELHDLVAAAERTRDPHRQRVRLGSGRNEPHLFGAGHRIHQFGGEADAVFVVGEEGEAAADLLPHRLQHLGMTVAEEHRAGAEQEIDVFAAVDVGDAAGMALADDQVARQVAEAAGRQHALRQVEDGGCGWGVIHRRLPVGLADRGRLPESAANG